jgi:hypothetical protein
MDESERGCDIAVRPRGKLKSGGDSHEQLNDQGCGGLHRSAWLSWAWFGHSPAASIFYVSISATRAWLFLWLLYREGSFQIGFYFDYSGGLLLATVMTLY